MTRRVTPIPKPKKRKPRQNYRQQADRIFSKFVRERDGECQAKDQLFPCKGNLQCAHVLPRRYATVRCDPFNAIALCASHHIYWTHRPIEFEDWVKAKYPGRWEALRRKAVFGGRVVWKDELDRVKREGRT